MQDSDILSYFDGRPKVHILLSAFQISAGDRIAAIAYELGYRQTSAGPASRTTYRMVFARDDSPDVQRRARSTMDRLRRGGPVLPLLPVIPHAGIETAPIKVASARRNVAAYESSSVKGLASAVGFVGLGAVLAALALRGRPAAVIALLVIAAALLGTAVATPALMKRWYERNKRVVGNFNRARAAERGTGPPSPPPLPPGAPGGESAGGGGR